MQAAVRREQPEGAPALVYIRIRSLFEAADIVTPKAEAG